MQGPVRVTQTHTGLGPLLSCGCLFIKDHSALTKHLKLPGILSNRVTGGAAD